MHGRHYFSPQQNGAKYHRIAWQCTFSLVYKCKNIWPKIKLRTLQIRTERNRLTINFGLYNSHFFSRRRLFRYVRKKKIIKFTIHKQKPIEPSKSRATLRWFALHDQQAQCWTLFRSSRSTGIYAHTPRPSALPYRSLTHRYESALSWYRFAFLFFFFVFDCFLFLRYFSYANNFQKCRPSRNCLPKNDRWRYPKNVDHSKQGRRQKAWEYNEGNR